MYRQGIWAETPEERFELVSKVLAGTSIQETSCNAGIDCGQLYQWGKKYKENGYDGLVNIPMGRPRKNSTMKKSPKNTKPLSDEEREELIRLRSEIEYLKTENEVIKKSMALRHTEWDRQLKAKKQKSSKNSEKKNVEKSVWKIFKIERPDFPLGSGMAISA